MNEVIRYSYGNHYLGNKEWKNGITLYWYINIGFLMLYKVRTYFPDRHE